jgi:membrane peptidoglycan carboxypeptidase
LVGTAVLGYLVFLAPAPHLDRSAIQQRLLTETTVYYRDQRTKLGAFYDQVHLLYLQANQPTRIDSDLDTVIPETFFDAIIASEDQSFHQHIGVDPVGILRASWANLLAGRVIQGGSTLTQQTSELLFEHRSEHGESRWTNKVLETMDALRLEARYSKRDILEFYTNLFHVHGTGQGLAIAARYYFNKNVSDLNLSELAFIAGSVKGPANYNPFRTQNPEEIQHIVERATERRDYVLRNMLEMGFISEERFLEASQDLVAFRQGSFRYQDNHQIEAVRQQMNEEPFRSILQGYGTEEVEKGELRIQTTLDPNLQYLAQFELRRHLSRLEFQRNGYVAPVTNPEPASLQPELGNFYTSRIEEVLLGDDPSVKVQVGTDQAEVRGLLLEEFIRRINPQASNKLQKKDFQQALANLKPGEPILVALHQRDNDGIVWQASIEQQPTLDGGVMILQDGEVRAFVGGFEPHGFNRAMQAYRQPGSTFKLLLYMVAMELGWNPLEVLSNEYRVYQWQGEIYIPKPDHNPPDNQSSMVWAGALSENLASIYLLEHLLDYLDLKQFERLVEFARFAREENESRANYVLRLRDTYGIIDTQYRMQPYLMEAARQELLRNTAFEPPEEEQALRNLYHGRHWRTEIRSRLRSGSARVRRERELLEHNFLRLQEVQERLQQQLVQTEDAFLNGNFKTDDEVAEEWIQNLYVHESALRTDPYNTPIPPRLAYAEDPRELTKGWVPITPYRFRLYNQVWTSNQRERFFSPANIWLHGKIRSTIFQGLEDLMLQRQQDILRQEPYSTARLYWNHDFRMLLSLQTLVEVAKLLGVESPLQPVLSFPLGANDVTLQDMALLYQSLVTGQVFGGSTPLKNRWSLIQRIEDTRGRIIYEADHQPRSILDPDVNRSLQEIMRSVVEYGTGRRAKRFLQTEYVREDGKQVKVKIPALGKTGTANNYSNATFVGHLPVPTRQGMQTKGGYTIAVYVGSDRPGEASDTARRFRLTGSSGALPVWSRIAYYLIQTRGYQERLRIYHPNLKSLEGRLLLNYATSPPLNVNDKNGLLEGEVTDRNAEVFLPLPDSKLPREIPLFLRLLEERSQTSAEGAWKEGRWVTAMEQPQLVGGTSSANIEQVPR